MTQYHIITKKTVGISNKHIHRSDYSVFQKLFNSGNSSIKRNSMGEVTIDIDALAKCKRENVPFNEFIYDTFKDGSYDLKERIIDAHNQEINEIVFGDFEICSFLPVYEHI